jgi:uncharacterized protein YrrD
MLRNLLGLMGSSIRAKDGEFGTAYDFLFDDRTWRVRYLVVESGGWLSRNRIVLSPAVLGTPDWVEKVLPVLLTKEQVQNSPDVDTEQPVSRQQEIAMSQYYGWSIDWSMEPLLVPVGASAIPASRAEGDPHLRSAKAVSRYEVSATDGEIGHVGDFIVDDVTWEIRYLTVKTGTWFAEQKLLVSTRWVESVSWNGERVLLNHARERV